MEGYFDESYGNWLPVEEDEVFISKCPKCGADIYSGQEVAKYDDVYYCDVWCIVAKLGILTDTIAEREED